MLNREQKSNQVENLKAAAENANALLVVDYRGMTVPDANAIRAKLREADGEYSYQVAKNTLAKRAFEGTQFAVGEELLSGPTAIAFCYDEVSVLAKALVDYSKDNEKFEIKGGVVDGEIVDIKTIQALAAVPTKHELRGMLAGTLQAPLRNLAGTMYSLLGHLRNALEQRQTQLDS